VKHTGPHLQSAVLCEKVIESNEGVLSLINIVDQITQSATGPEPPQQMPAFMLKDLKLVVMLKADQARGRYALKIRPQDPSGRNLPIFEVPVQLGGGNSGMNIVTDIQLPIELEGLYWFDVLFAAGGEEDRLLTRLPLTVMYQPQRTGPASPA
jgi:Family of unknown function (DUF6941)